MTTKLSLRVAPATISGRETPGCEYLWTVVNTAEPDMPTVQQGREATAEAAQAAGEAFIAGREPAAAPRAAVLDFEVIARASSYPPFGWVVFEARTGHAETIGTAKTRAAATLAALAYIAERTPKTIFITRARDGWSLWHPRGLTWVPMPLTTAADAETARAYAAGLPLAKDRTVSIITSAV